MRLIDNTNANINQQNIDSIVYNNYFNKPIRHFLTAPGAVTNSDFKGREEEIIEIEKQLQGGVLILVNGEGGIGKTSLAAKYWEVKEANYKHLIWVYGENGIVDTLLNSSLAKELDINLSLLTTKENQIESFRTALVNLEKDCLIVIDNANDSEEIDKFLIHFSSIGWHILMTSRCENLDINSYTISHLPKHHALTIFKNIYEEKTPHFDFEIDLFLQNIGYNTLAIIVFAKYLRTRNQYRIGTYPLSKLLLDFREKGLFLDDINLIKHEYQKNKLNDILLNLYNLDKANFTHQETDLLINLAVLPAQSIDYEIIVQLLLSSNVTTFKHNLSKLNEKGWLTCTNNPNGGVFRLSPVVQQIILYQYQDNLLERVLPLISRLIEKLEYTHHHVIHKNAYIYMPFAENVLSTIKNNNLILGTLAQRIGEFYNITGDFEKSLYFFNKKFFINQELFMGNRNNREYKRDFAISNEKMGKIYQSLGNFERASKYFQEELNLFDELQNDFPNEMDFVDSLVIAHQNVGNILLILNKNNLALFHFEAMNALQIERYNFSKNDVEKGNSKLSQIQLALAVSYLKLGNVNFSLNQFDISKTYYKEFNLLTKELFDRNRDDINFQNALAVSYEKLGTVEIFINNFILDDAISYFEESIRLNKVLCDNNVENVVFKNNLADCYIGLGNCLFKKEDFNAKIYFQNAEEIWSDLLNKTPFNNDYVQKIKEVKEKITRTTTFALSKENRKFK